MLQMVRRFFIMLMTLSVCSCNEFDIRGLFMPPGDDVDSRFEQSAEMNEDLNAAVLEVEESYVFYVATDPHIDLTNENLSRFNDELKNDTDASFGVILGDCTDMRDNLPRYLDAFSYDPERHASDPQIFHLLGNHDVFFNGWNDFKKMVGPSVYWFEAVFSGGKDLYITLDTASGTLGKKQNEWFRAFLEKNRSRYRHCVILTHCNFFYTDNSQTGSGNMPIEESFSLIDFLGKQNVSLVLQGHDHYREQIIYMNINYTVVGAISDISKAPEYLRVEVCPKGIHLDWHLM